MARAFMLALIFLCVLVPSAHAQRTVSHVNTLADLLTYPNFRTQTNVWVAGRTAAGDGFEGLFTWNSGDTTAADTNSIFASTVTGAPTGRWRRAWSQQGLFLDNRRIKTITGSPEGVETDGTGALRLDRNGKLWIKTSGTGNTGWTEISAGGGGGSTVWTNIAGTIQPLTGQTTNRLSFTSGAADNATNVAMKVDTSTLWTQGILFALQTLTTNRFAVDHTGRIVTPFKTLFDGNFHVSEMNSYDEIATMYYHLTGDWSSKTSGIGIDFELFDDGNSTLTNLSTIIGIESGNAIAAPASTDPSVYLPGSNGSIGLYGWSGGASGEKLGVVGHGLSSGALNIGVAGVGNSAATNAIGVFGSGGATATGASVGGYFETYTGTTAPTLTDAVLLLDNRGTGFPFIIARENGAIKFYVAALSGYTGAGTLFLSDDGTYKSTGGSGDVVGPGSATDNAFARFDTTTGKLIQNSVVSATDVGAITQGDGTQASLTYDWNLSGASDPRITAANGSLANNVVWLGPNGTASAPTYSFSNDTDVGLYYDGNLVMTHSGTAQFGFQINTLQLRSSGNIGWSSGAIGGSTDLFLVRAAANTLAIRNGANAQSIHISRTFTDTSNYDRLALNTAAGTFTIAAETAGTGTDNINIAITPAGTGGVVINGGTPLTKALSATATLDFPNTLAQTDSDLTITVTGAADGDTVDIGVPNGSTLTGSCYSGWVSAANTVTIRFSVYGVAAKDPASGSFRATIWKF